MADHPVPFTINADAPDDKSDAADECGRVCKPQTHLRLFDAGVALGQADDEPITQCTGAEDLRDECANDEAEEEKALALRGVGLVCDGDEGNDAQNPPVPEKFWLVIAMFW